MKPKKLSKKLELNKKTIANMNGDMMGNVNGGIIIPTKFANTCFEECPTVTYVTCETCVTCQGQGSNCDSQCPYICDM